MPIKSPGRAKRRIAEALDAEAHRDLTRALLDDALDFCSRTDALDWWVVSDDERVREQAEASGLNSVADDGVGLNDAVGAGFDAAAREGAGSVLVVPGDVPLAQPEDAQDILDTGALSDVVVVPASDGGTNGLFLSLPTEMTPRFGPESLRVHVEEAQRLALRCTILDLPHLSVDLDTPEDARQLLEMARTGDGTGSRTLEVLARLYG